MDTASKQPIGCHSKCCLNTGLAFKCRDRHFFRIVRYGENEKLNPAEIIKLEIVQFSTVGGGTLFIGGVISKTIKIFCLSGLEGWKVNKIKVKTTTLAL